MRALVSHQVGGPDSLTLEEIEAPRPGPGQLLIAVRACGINYPDVLTIEDKYQSRPTRPFAPGGEIAGMVLATGDGMSEFTPGDRVLAAPVQGGLAEQVVSDADKSFRIPQSMGFDEAAALLFTYGTSLHALKDRGHLGRGQTLLVLGAAGGVGLAAVEIGKAMGATVVAAVSSEEKAAVARTHGADATVTYPREVMDREAQKSLSQVFKSAVGSNGADVIYDPVGGAYVEPALRSIAWGGRYLVVGFPAGIPAIPLNLPLLKSCDIAGVFWGAFTTRDPAANRANAEVLFAWHAEGKIKPLVSERYALKEGGKAIARLAGRHAVGKIIVTME